MAGLQRASVFAIRKETTSGDYLAPSSGTQFVPLRPGNTVNFEPELLESDELLNDIGAAKSAIGKEAHSGSHSVYVKHSGVEGQEPEAGVFYESLMGAKSVASTEYNTVAASTTTVIKVDSGEGATFQEGEALLIKDGSNGYSIRNVQSISGDDLTLNFKVGTAPGVGIDLGKAVLYYPASTDHPTFSGTKYLGNGHAIEATAGNTVTEASISGDANGYLEAEFSYEGTKYFFNPLEVTSSNKYLDFTDDAGTFAASVVEKVYKTPHELAAALESSMNSVSTETYTVSYSNTDGKFTIATSTSSTLNLEWNTGANTANTIGALIGFSVAANDTGALTYTSDNALSFAASYTPSYDAGDKIVLKGAELFVGSQTDNVCICAQSVEITVSKEVEDIDCICEESGVSEKIATSRSVEMSVTATLNKYDAGLLSALLNNTTVQAMLNAGPKLGGNWVAGKCFNVFIQSGTVSGYTTTGENFIQAEFTITGHVTSTKKDVYLNFI